LQPPPEASPRPAAGSRSRFWEWVRHHTTAVISTIVDYSVLVAMVELVGLGPVPATPISAFAGAVTNFTLNRTFTYHAAQKPIRGQLLRFVLVSACSLGLNTLGEFLFLKVPHLHYMVARVITSTIVSNVWNYPLLRFFVFSERRSSRA
jgi:putative flippase GtrA